MNAVLNLFPSRSAKAVLDILDLYGVESYESERERVQMAILHLSQGSEDKLLQFVETAKQDYRDVLYWAEYPQSSPQDAPVLEVLRETWAWILNDPTQVLMVNAFGNVLVTCHDGTLWRVIPEELTARKIRDDRNYVATFEDAEFREDWQFEGVTAAAREALGPLSEGQCYAFKTWPIMGGPFVPDNMYIATMTEWLGVSGEVGRQIKDLPNGAKITLDIIDERHVRVVPAEEIHQSLPAFDSVEAGVREVIALLAREQYEELERYTHGSRMSAADLARAVQEYGKTIVPSPEPIEDLLDIVEVRGAASPTWSVVVPLYTREEGRSDLTAEFTVVESGEGKVRIAIDNVHVR